MGGRKQISLKKMFDKFNCPREFSALMIMRLDVRTLRIRKKKIVSLHCTDNNLIRISIHKKKPSKEREKARVCILKDTFYSFPSPFLAFLQFSIPNSLHSPHSQNSPHFTTHFPTHLSIITYTV